MTLSPTSLHSDDLKEPITLYRLISQTDIIRNIQKPALEMVGFFKAAIEDNPLFKPDDSVADIYSIKKIFVRVSNFYRQAFIRNNYIRYKGTLMRIASTNYYRLSGVSVCMCYNVDEF